MKKMNLNKVKPGQTFIRQDGKECILVTIDRAENRYRYRFRLIEEKEDFKKEIEHFKTKIGKDDPYCPSLNDTLLREKPYFQNRMQNPMREFNEPCHYRMRKGDWYTNQSGRHSQWRNDPYNITQNSSTTHE